MAAIHGLLKGLGQGAAQTGQMLMGAELEKLRQKRAQNYEQRQAKKERQFQREQTQQERQFQREEGRRSREHQEGLLSQVSTNRQGEAVGLTAGGEAKNLGYRVPTEGSGGRGMSPEENRIWKATVSRHTKEGELGAKETDWDAVAQTLRQQGNENLARMASSARNMESGVDTTSDEYLEAEQRANEWVDSQAGWLSTDASDFSEYGGNREEARQAKTMEIYRELTGQNRQGGQGRSGGLQNRQSAKGGQSGQGRESQSNRGNQQSRRSQDSATDDLGLDGSGTRENPYKASTQQQVDRFTRYAPKGAVIEINGELYTK